MNGNSRRSKQRQAHQRPRLRRLRPGVGHHCQRLPELIYFSAAKRAARHRGEKEGREECGVGPGGALGFHYAKPQMESCDRVSLHATRAPGAHKAAGIRLLRCNVTEKLNSLVLCDRLRPVPLGPIPGPVPRRSCLQALPGVNKEFLQRQRSGLEQGPLSRNFLLFHLFLMEIEGWATSNTSGKPRLKSVFKNL